MHTQFTPCRDGYRELRKLVLTSKIKFLELTSTCCGGRALTWSAQLQVMAFVAEEDGAKHMHEGAITVDELKVSINYLKACALEDCI